MTLSHSAMEQRAASGDANAQIALARHLSGAGQRQDAEIWLRRAAGTGHPDAMAALGDHLLAGSPDPATIQEAQGLIQSAAQAGSAFAAYLLARMTVAQITNRDNWRIGLNYLAHAAAGGHIPAQIELAFLAGEGGMVLGAVSQGRSLPPQTWPRLHAAIDPVAWTVGAARVQTMSADPFIGMIRNFVSPDICDWIIHWARSGLTPATSYDAADGRSVANHKTTSPELDFVVTSVIHRISALTRIPINGKEGTSVLRYQPGEQFEPHYDFLDPGDPARAAEILKTGQRLVTFLVSLSDDFEGGETDFPKAGYRYKGGKGDAVFWRNVTKTGQPDYQAQHAGRLLTRGEKWAFVRVCTHIPDSL